MMLDDEMFWKLFCFASEMFFSSLLGLLMMIDYETTVFCTEFVTFSVNDDEKNLKLCFA